MVQYTVDKAYCRVYISESMPILRHLNLVNPHYNFYFITTLSSTYKSSETFLSFTFPYQTFISIFYFYMHALFQPFPSPLFQYSNIVIIFQVFNFIFRLPHAEMLAYTNQGWYSSLRDLPVSEMCFCRIGTL